MSQELVIHGQDLCQAVFPPLGIMNRHLFCKPQPASRLLFERTRRVGHIQPTAAIADWKSVVEDVLAKLYRHLRIKRLHESFTKDVPGDDVGMTGAKDQVTIGMNPGPVKGHKAAFIAERVEIVGKPMLEVLATKLAGSGDNIRRN